MKKKCLTIEDLNIAKADHLMREIGKYGIYFKKRADDVDLDTAIFRYLKISNLLSMIEDSKLYIPNRNKFTDLRDKLGMEKYIPRSTFDFQINSVPSYKEKRWRRELKREKDMCMDVCISCWTMDKRLDGSVDESFLMWKAYSSMDLTCRVKTTIQDFIDSIVELPCDIVISDVEYHNKATTYDALVFQKTQYYDSEHEIRIVALTRGKDHIEIPINPYVLLKGIQTSPFIPPFVESCIINGLKSKYNKLKDIIEPSKVMEYPFIK